MAIDWQVMNGGTRESRRGATSAEAVGAHMPADLTLDDLAAMATADGFGHRYEMSPDGVVSIMPSPGSAHGVVATRLLAWFVRHDWPVEQVVQNCGVRVVVDGGVGGRVPDLTVWSRPQLPDLVWGPVDALLLAVEIVSPGSDKIDHRVKKDEYARAGVPRYWIVDRDAAHTVTRLRLASGGYVAAGAPQPLAWLLNTEPRDHLG